MQKIELNKLTIELIASNLILITLNDGVTIEVEDVHEVKKHNLSLTKGNDYAIVFDAGYYTTITKEAREIMTSSKIEKGRKASAFVISGLSQKILGNFYVKINKPGVPTKFFSDKEKAIIWAKEILNQ